MLDSESELTSTALFRQLRSSWHPGAPKCCPDLILNARMQHSQVIQHILHHINDGLGCAGPSWGVIGTPWSAAWSAPTALRRQPCYRASIEPVQLAIEHVGCELVGFHFVLVGAHPTPFPPLRKRNVFPLTEPLDSSPQLGSETFFVPSVGHSQLFLQGDERLDDFITCALRRQPFQGQKGQLSCLRHDLAQNLGHLHELPN